MINTPITIGVYTITEPTEYSQMKCRAPAARFAARFQIACVIAASRTAASAISGMNEREWQRA